MEEILATLSIDKKNNNQCQHFAFINNSCACCKKTKNKCDNPTTIQLRYIDPKLSLTLDAIRRVRDRDLETLLKRKKLHLVLDLDNTLIHTKKVNLKDRKKNKMGKDDDVFEILGGDWLVKLRPGTCHFLERVSTMFDLSIYTMAEQSYAREVGKLLEANMGVFDNNFCFTRVISKEHGTKSDRKGLDVVLSYERVVLNVDDCEEVWGEHKANLIQIKPYNFFNQKSPLEDDQDLARVLEVLSTVYNVFYDKKDRNFSGKDVRQVLENVRDQFD
ncbi:RNA polymerase II C-terminal domain phosphatase-like 4 [Chenopodium quinoa]|uniref:protein-serine/threonine phosphatase n=1 Tax=Chenopodium quinoa TaxID=63459 RepID=A0A803LQ46_CHEQI|nr:RNA polymerase II C-terminal domain phosphatase-like 4 [Chenopodium quinoa]